MIDTTSTDVTSSENSDKQSPSVSAIEICEAIEKQPDAWFQQNNQLIATQPVGDASAKEIREAFENRQFPDGTPLANATGLVSDQRIEVAFNDYLTNTDEWRVQESMSIDPWPGIKRMYADSNNDTARQNAVDQLKDELNLVSLNISDELLRYNDGNGTYEDDAERIVRELLEKKLRQYNTAHEAKQILYKLKSQASLNVDAFAPEGKVCVKNGILDVSEPSEPTLESHSPEIRFLQRLSVKYDPDADAPRFKQFIDDQVADGDAEKLQEFVGYTVFQPWEMPFPRALMFVGPTATGKSTFLNVLTALLGEENVSHLSIQQLANDEYALSQAHGNFANISNDLDASIVENVGRFKHIAAGEPVEANRKYKDYRTVRMTQKQIYATNRVPEVKDEDDAFYRRWLHVQFPETIPRDEREEQFENELKAELPGILNWALEGYARLIENGGFTGELSLEEKRNLWKAYGNSIDRFVEERTERVPDSDIPKNELYAAYERFCREQGLPAKAKQTFTKHLKRDYDVDTNRPKLNGEQVRCYRGLYPIDADEDEESDSGSPSWPDELVTSE